MAELARKFVIGYALSPKKQRSFIQASLVNLERERGIDLIKIDLEKPLVDQRLFNCVLHKFYGEKWNKQLEEYLKKYPNCLIIDSPMAIERLRNHISMLQVVEELRIKNNSPESFGIPKQVL